MTAYETDLHKLDVLLQMVKKSGARTPIKYLDFYKQAGITVEDGEYFITRYSKSNNGFIDMAMGVFIVMFRQDIDCARLHLIEGLAEKKRDLLQRRLKAWVPLWSLVLAFIAFVFSLIWTFTAQRSVEKEMTDVEHRLTLLEQRNALTK
ncbi:MAG: hypothetical protein ACLQVA_08325 [Candidatus Brocadiia bacterium]